MQILSVNKIETEDPHGKYTDYQVEYLVPVEVLDDETGQTVAYKRKRTVNLSNLQDQERNYVEQVEYLASETEKVNTSLAEIRKEIADIEVTLPKEVALPVEEAVK